MAQFKTRRLKEDVPPPQWVLWLKKGLSLALRLRGPLLLWYKDFKKEQMEKMKEERRLRLLKRLLLIFGTTLCVLLIFAGTVRALVQMRVITLGGVFSVVGQELPRDEYGYTNILLLGRGDRGHDGIDLTDSMMIVSIDPRHRNAVMISMPRDLYVLDPNFTNKGRINSLYREYKNYIKEEEKLSAEEASTKALNAVAQELGSQFGIAIHRTVIVNFSAFTELVDAMGGLDIVVPKALVDTEYPNENENGYETFSIAAGPQRLDGKTALKYARSRHSTSDFDRSARQQQIIHALAEKAKESGWLTNPAKLIDLWHIVSTNTETTMTMGELLGLGAIAQRVDRDKVMSVQLSDRSGYDGLNPTPGGLLYTPPREDFNGASILLPVSLPAFPVTYKQIRVLTFLLLKDRKMMLQHPDVVIWNSGAKPGTAGALAAELMRFNLPVSDASNDPRKQKNETSKVIARSPADEDVATYFGALLHMPVEVQKEPVKVHTDGTVDMGETEDLPPIVISLGKDYVYTPLQSLVELPTPPALSSASSIGTPP